MTLMALVVAVTAGAQVMDTILTGNTVNMNLNYAKLDSIIADLQAKVATLEAAQNSTFDGDYNSLTNQPTIPSNVSDLTNDAGYTTVSQADSIAVGVAWRGELSNADLTDANLTNANIYGADLTSADLTGVIWTGAYIENCTGCTCVDSDNDNFCD